MRQDEWDAGTDAAEVADVAAAQKLGRDGLLAALRNRLNRFQQLSDRAVVLDAAALAEAAALCHLSADLDADVETQVVVGSLHWARAHCLQPGEGKDDFLAACGFLLPLYRTLPDKVPGLVRQALDRIGAGDGAAPDLLAVSLLCQARLTGNPLAFDRCIDYVRHWRRELRDLDKPVSRAAPADSAAGQTRTQLGMVLNLALHAREGLQARVRRTKA